MADSKISNLPVVSSPNGTDVLPIVSGGITKKITVNNLLAGASVITLPIVRLLNVNNTGQSTFYGGGGDTTNSIDYVTFLNTKDYETDSSVLEGNLSNMNVIIKSTGRYEIFSSINFFNISTASGFLRLRIYGSTSPISPDGGTGQYLGGNTLLQTIDQGPTFVAVSGECGKRGSFILNVTSVPYYIISVFLHSGGSGAPAGNGAYLSGNNNTGYQPELLVRKLTN